MSLIFCSDLFVIACTQNTLNLCADWGCTKHEVYVVWNSAAPNGKFFDLAMVLWAWRWSRFYSPLLFVRSNHQRRREVQSLWMLQIWISEFKTNFQFFFRKLCSGVYCQKLFWSCSSDKKNILCTNESGNKRFQCRNKYTNALLTMIHCIYFGRT